MSQALRVALWVPTEDPPEVGDGVLTRDVQQAAKVLPTRFALAGGGSGGGIEEAPVNDRQYARKNAMWAEVETGSGGPSGIPEAPFTGKPYVRQDFDWLAFDIIDAGTF